MHIKRKIKCGVMCLLGMALVSNISVGLAVAGARPAAHLQQAGNNYRAVKHIKKPTGSSEQQAIRKFFINDASAANWQALKGLGPKRAAAIVDYRKKHGSFAQPADVAQVKGISAASLLRIAKKNNIKFAVH